MTALTSTTPLVIIDMQEIFRAQHSQWFVPGYADAATNVARLAEALPGSIVWTRFVRDPDELGGWREYYDRWNQCRSAPESSDWDVTLPIADGDSTLSLPTFSKWGPQLADMTADADRVVICGVATDCCVLSTVFGAVDAGKSVTVVTDACAGITDEAHQKALALMNLLAPMVTLTTTEEVVGSVPLTPQRSQLAEA